MNSADWVNQNFWSNMAKLHGWTRANIETALDEMSHDPERAKLRLADLMETMDYIWKMRCEYTSLEELSNPDIRKAV